MGYRKIERGTQYTERGQYTGYKVKKRGSDTTYEFGNVKQHRNKKEPTY